MQHVSGLTKKLAAQGGAYAGDEKRLRVIGWLFAAMAFFCFADPGGDRAVAQDLPKASPPVLVTSLGQSLDGFQVQLAVRRAKVNYEYEALAGVDKLAGKKSLFLAVGASLKGFGDAGISIQDELRRAGHLLDEAEKNGVTIVTLHMGGEERRDDLSNQLIAFVAPRSDVLIIRQDSDGDGLFSRIAQERGIPLVTVSDVRSLSEPLQQMFASGLD